MFYIFIRFHTFCPKRNSSLHEVIKHLGIFCIKNLKSATKRNPLNITVRALDTLFQVYVLTSFFKLCPKNSSLKEVI